MHETPCPVLSMRWRIRILEPVSSQGRAPRTHSKSKCLFFSYLFVMNCTTPKTVLWCEPITLFLCHMKTVGHIFKVAHFLLPLLEKRLLWSSQSLAVMLRRRKLPCLCLSLLPLNVGICPYVAFHSLVDFEPSEPQGTFKRSCSHQGNMNQVIMSLERKKLNIKKTRSDGEKDDGAFWPSSELAWDCWRGWAPGCEGAPLYLRGLALLSMCFHDDLFWNRERSVFIFSKTGHHCSLSKHHPPFLERKILFPLKCRFYVYVCLSVCVP